jgi:uncharacterized membrane protein HdeD (DUF308 family)
VYEDVIQIISQTKIILDTGTISASAVISPLIGLVMTIIHINSWIYLFWEDKTTSRRFFRLFLIIVLLLLNYLILLFVLENRPPNDERLMPPKGHNRVSKFKGTY